MKQTIIAYLKNEPGVLNRISRLFYRLNYNIESITAGKSKARGISRVTIICNHTDHYNKSLIIDNLHQLNCVSEVNDITEIPSIIREYALFKVKIESDQSKTFKKLIESNSATIIDNFDSIFIVESSGKTEEIEGLINKLKNYNILEIMRSGKMAMVESGQDRDQFNFEEDSSKKSWTTQQISDALF
ncbi:MAG: acetolactate synthase small subunit [Candidatus Marinimicrobia bacterium]|nr:acetolactate synthase small subunit [Candidatus Neomarinimicrobiota bacterium]|tara:strand:- start:8707 stop:9267 length:561 start_codon:yes stop_codon:yes gene_type:complete